MRRRTVLLVGLMILGSALEVIGIGAVVPVIALLTGDDSLAGQWLGLLPALGTAIASTDHQTLIIGAMAGLVFLFMIKGLFQWLVAARVAAFTYQLQAQLSHDLLATYLDQSHLFHVSRNSGQLASTVNNEARDAATGINTLLLVATEGMTIIAVAGLIIAVAPFAGVATAVGAAVAGGMILLVSRRVMAMEGERMRHQHALKMQWLQQALAGSKELALLGRQAGFLSAFDAHNRAQADAARRQSVWSSIPRLWLETIAVAALALIVILLQDGPSGTAMPLVGLFAATAFRLIPSANRLINGLQSFGYFAPTLGHVLDELALPRSRDDLSAVRPMVPRHSIRMENVGFRYGEGLGPIIEGVDLIIGAGSMTGIVGASGAGKSTLLDIFTGILPPTEGHLLVDGEDVAGNIRGWQSGIGLVPQAIFLVDDSLRRNIALGIPAEHIDEAAVWRAVDLASIRELVEALPDGLDTIVGDKGARLSGGQRQRIAIARALYHSPAVLVMDEGTSALDVATEGEIISSLHRLKGSMTVVVATHRPEVLNGCDTIIEVSGGRCLAIAKPGSAETA